MNAAIRMLRSLCVAVPLALALAWSSDARADVFDTLVSIVHEMEKTGVSPFPVKSSEIQVSKGLVVCIGGGSSVPDCLIAFSQTSDGQKILGAGTKLELPPWLEKIVSAYVHLQNDDFWGLVGDLGEAAICVIAQFMAAGIDVCDLLKELIALGEAVLDAATAVAKFAAEVGGAVWDGLKSAGCSLGLGGCGSETPPEIVAYKCYFAPKVESEGVPAREAVDPAAYPKLRAQLEAGVQKPFLCNGFAHKPLSATQAATAAGIFDNAVDGAWTAHLLKAVLPQRDKKRLEYATSQQVVAVATAVAAAFDGYKGSLCYGQVADCIGKPIPGPWVQDWIVKRCAVDDFGVQFQFAHVDRWVAWRAQGKTELQKEALKAGNVTSNADWCKAEFFGKHVPAFADVFVGVVKAKYCPAFGNAVMCGTLAGYEACSGLMSAVNNYSFCTVNAAGIGKDLASQINEYFVKNLQSKYAPCDVVLPDGGQSVSTKPVGFVCRRPTQRHFCEERYNVLWKHKNVKPLDCAPAQPDAAYLATVEKVKAAVAGLKPTYPGLSIDLIDPLMVHAGSSATYQALSQADAGKPQRSATLNFAFQQLAALTIDGKSRPTIVGIQKIVPPSEAVALPTKPGMPEPKASIGNLATSPVAQAGAGAIGAAASAAIGPASQPAPVTSGPAPVGAAGSGAAPAVAVSPATPMPPPAARLPATGTPGATPTRPAAMPGSALSQAQLPAVQSPIATRSGAAPALPAPTQSRLPAVQSPSPAGAAAGAATRAPDWGNVPSVRNAPLPPPGTAPTVAPTAVRAPKTLDADTARALAVASCTRVAGSTGLDFTCASPAGLERCEYLKRLNKVDQCALAGAGR